MESAGASLTLPGLIPRPSPSRSNARAAMMALASWDKVMMVTVLAASTLCNP